MYLGRWQARTAIPLTLFVLCAAATSLLQRWHTRAPTHGIYNFFHLPHFSIRDNVVKPAEFLTPVALATMHAS